MSELTNFLKETEISSEYCNTLLANYAVLLLRDYINGQPDSFSRQSYNGNCLGIQSEDKAFHSTYNLACRAFNLRHCRYFAEDLGIRSGSGSSPEEIRSIIYKQMDGLVNCREPMVFFIPPKLATYPCSGRTRYELDYLYDHASSNINAKFVLGAYNDSGRNAISRFRAEYV